MTLNMHPGVTQRTQQWEDLRRGILTASTAHRIITPTLKTAANDHSRGLALILASERITGWTEPSNFHYQRGILDEPVARDFYHEHVAPVEEHGIMDRDDWGFRIGYSPDGIVGDVGLIEIKSRIPKVQLEHVITDYIPFDAYTQMQCGLLVSGRAWCDYVSFSGGMAFWTKRVYPDADWHRAIIRAAGELENTIAEHIATYTAKTDGQPMTERVDYMMDMAL